MSEIQIKFEPSVPRGAQKELRDLLKPVLGILDGEVRVIRVTMKKDPDVDGEASTMTWRRYHFAVIALDFGFFTLDEDEKRLVMMHEVVHVLHDLYAREVFHVLIALVPEEVRDYVGTRLEDAEERVVDKIAMSLVKMREGR